MQPSSSPARQLPRRFGRTIDDGGDFVEGHREHVVQYERDAFRGREQVQHDEQCGANRFGQDRLARRIIVVSGARQLVGDRSDCDFRSGAA